MRPSTPRDQAAFERDERIDACIVAENVEALFAIFTSGGVACAMSLRHMPYGVEFYVRDPDGYVLGFVSPRLNEPRALRPARMTSAVVLAIPIDAGR